MGDYPGADICNDCCRRVCGSHLPSFARDVRRIDPQ